MTRPKIASLWIGPRLSYLEQLCLKSFADFGHSVDLYAYDEIENLPPGVTLRDASPILDGSDIARHTGSGSPAIHADAFRYHLLAQQDVIWVDADMLCTRPWDFAPAPVFGWEKDGKVVCNAVLGLAPQSETLRELLDLVSDPYPIPPWAKPEEKARLLAAKAEGAPVHVSDLAWGVWGPAALTHYLIETGEIADARPQAAFYPVTFRDRRDFLKPGAELGVGDDTLGVHLWNRRLSRRLVTAEGGIPRAGSLLADALARHDIDLYAAPIPDRPPAGTEYVPRVRGWHQTPPKQAASVRVETWGDAKAPRLEPPRTPPETGRVLVVSCMKNEGPFILEWIAYHQLIGVTDFLIYTNDCEDSTVALLDRLQALGHVARYDNPYDAATNERPQHAALKAASKGPEYAETDWALVIDVDEFLNIHVGDGTIDALLKASNYPNVASFTWKQFGNGGVVDFEDLPVTQQFLRCAPEILGPARQGWGFKTMHHKSAPFGRLGVHRPLDLAEGGDAALRWVNGSGRQMPESLHQRGWRSNERTLGYKYATLNHYVLRSAESFLVKRERGRVNHTRQDQGLSYWQRRNYNTEEDRRMRAWAPALEKRIAELKADPELNRLHREAVDWHSGRAASLRQQPGYRDLFAAISEPRQIDALLMPKFSGDLPLNPSDAAVYAASKLEPPNGTGATPNNLSALAKICRARGGFSWFNDTYGFAFVPGSSDLVVSFDDQQHAGFKESRSPANFQSIVPELGASILGVMAADSHWFRSDFVHDGIEHLAAHGFFDTFERVLFMGASMGGFAALTYARQAPSARVLAIAPQSTLDPALMPDDRRWRWTRRLDWTGRYGDAVSGLQGTRPMVLSDPRDPFEVAQIDRMREKVDVFGTPFSGTKTGVYLRRTGGMTELISAALAGKVSQQMVARLLKDRREIPKYIRQQATRAEAQGNIGRALRIINFAQRSGSKRGYAEIRERLEKSLAEDGKPALASQND